MAASNAVALAWSSEAGRIYKVQSKGDGASGSWADAAGELSATKTNTAALIYAGGQNRQFYRVDQVR